MDHDDNQENISAANANPTPATPDNTQIVEPIFDIVNIAPVDKLVFMEPTIRANFISYKMKRFYFAESARTV